MVRKITMIRRMKGARPITIVRFDDTGQEDHRGNPVHERVEITVTGWPSFSRRIVSRTTEALGQQVVIDAEIFLREEDFFKTGIEAPIDPEKKRPQAIVDNASYDIYEAENPGHGMARFVCQKKRVS